MTSLQRLAQGIDSFNDVVGKAAAWTALAMVLIQFIVVVMRYVFGLGSIMMQESVVYLHAFLFMIGAGYTLLHGGHVRVDVFYREASERWKSWIDFAGVFVFLLPVCLLVWWFSFPYVENSWKVFEGSKETSGIQGVFLLKSVILAFAFLVAIQGVSMAIRSFLRLLRLAGVETPDPGPRRPAQR